MDVKKELFKWKAKIIYCICSEVVNLYVQIKFYTIILNDIYDRMKIMAKVHLNGGRINVRNINTNRRNHFALGAGECKESHCK